MTSSTPQSHPPTLAKHVTLNVRLNKPYQFAKVEWNFQTNKEILWFFNNPLPTRCKSLLGLLQVISTSRRTGICPIPAWHHDLSHIMMIMHATHGSWTARSRCFSRDATKWTRNATSAWFRISAFIQIWCRSELSYTSYAFYTMFYLIFQKNRIKSIIEICLSRPWEPDFRR